MPLAYHLLLRAATNENVTADTEENTTSNQPQWNSTPAWKLPGWVEPVVVVAILLTAMYTTRYQGYSIFSKRQPTSKTSLIASDDDNSRPSSSSHLLPENISDSEADYDDELLTTKNPPKKRRVCGSTFLTPNTARFRNNWHSRVLQRFPFLIEMFYWVINYAFYRLTAVLSQWLFGGSGIWQASQEHGIAVLEFEESGFLSFLFPVREHNVQEWFMNGHQGWLSALNKTYALIHIPGTVGFIAWYYHSAPTHPTFATIRRTLTLTNFLAFLTFILYPCMPPRLLPPHYGFLDTVRHDDATSVWMKGKFVNSLAAMPSMHFGYAFCIGLTLLYHSQVLRLQRLERGEVRKSWFWRAWFVMLGLLYPALILVTIVATANHYFLDALVASAYVVVAFMANRVFYVFLPLEDWLLWALRAEKPVPSTGRRFGR
ncbi:hypothetical protein K402DRAFT_338647 [Aulographum hederae CBS 113979]|uniref:Inositolphosphotransferase Aur1/Ipt1 domain-containing protein n=1 Tax=Aulographum hederae CBS 113979 TaxID=1176131 RepID=A0A6G1GRB0_9PEZI|nr:hypothetical protein K402DRAFT_338647 [Aulographum hederae CBS 113979]